MVFEVAEKRISESLVRVFDAVTATVDQLETLYGESDTLTGVPTGYTELDNILLGLQPSNLIVAAARPGMGKTRFALGAAANVAMVSRRPVVFFSMEMGSVELTKRMLAAEARVDAAQAADRRALKDADWSRLNAAIGHLGEAPLFIDDNPHCTVMEMRAKARRIKARHGDLGLVVVDYLQLMSSPRRSENRQVEVSEISRGLKILARELDCPVMALSQLNRQLEYRQDKRPMLADLRESGSIEQDADVVLFIYRDEAYNPESDQRGVGRADRGQAPKRPDRGGPPRVPRPLRQVRQHGPGVARAAWRGDPRSGPGVASRACGRSRAPEARCSSSPRWPWLPRGSRWANGRRLPCPTSPLSSIEHGVGGTVTSADVADVTPTSVLTGHHTVGLRLGPLWVLPGLAAALAAVCLLRRLRSSPAAPAGRRLLRGQSLERAPPLESLA